MKNVSLGFALISLLWVVDPETVAQTTTQTVVLREMNHPAGPAPNELSRLSDNIWRILKSNLSKVKGLRVQEVNDSHLREETLSTYVSKLGASHVIFPTFDTTAIVPVVEISLVEWATGRIAFTRRIVLSEPRQKDPTDFVNTLSNKISGEITGKTVKEILFAGCFKQQEAIVLTNTQLYKLPRKLKDKLNETELKDQYKIESFKSNSLAMDACRGEVDQRNLRDYELTGKILPDEVWLDINRYEQAWRSIEHKIPQSNALEQELAVRVARCMKTGDGCS